MGRSSLGAWYSIRMTHALLLCLCLLGLSHAAPKGRNIRWCVTSDIEDKECNDLAHSCTVHEIHLICVKKSSTSDCVKAISDGEADAISLDGEDVYEASLKPFNLKPIMVESYQRDSRLVHLSPCQKQRLRVPRGELPVLGAFVPECDEWDNYSPKQCHGSTGYCWCVDEDGKEIEGTKTPPGQQSPTCEEQKSTRCLRHRHSALKGHKPKLGAYVPDCDEKGNYVPSQCHGTEGHCWCVTPHGEVIEKTRTAPYKVPKKCEDYIANNLPCLKERHEALSGGRPAPGAFVPKCNEKGKYESKQCSGSSGYCWCVNGKGQKIDGTETPPGQQSPKCEEEHGEEEQGTKFGPGHEDIEQVTCHYAVAVVKKSSTFQFDQLKGKRSCHSAVETAAGWAAPLYALMKKNLLVWKGTEEKTIEKAVSEFFSSSCVPGAKEPNLCKQCAGEEDNCKHGPGEPYNGDEGAFKCLSDDKGDVAFVESSVLSEERSDSYELLCPDNTRKPLSQYKDCNLGKDPRHAVVTRSSGDQIKDITEYLLGAQSQKKECELFSSTHGKKLLFEDTTTSLIALPSEMDTFLFLGSDLFSAMKALHGEHPPSHNELRLCTLNEKEKLKCDDWSSVSGGAIKCTEPALAEECIEKILKGEADVASFSRKQMYPALKCGLVPAFEEYHNEDELAPCEKPGAHYADFGEPSSVVVVKKSDQDITLKNLKGKKSCHTGVGDTAGWYHPVLLAKKQTNSCDLGSFFSQSCAPGSATDSNLCALCIGDPEHSEANTKCSASDKEAYYGSDGAIRCLVEKGDVAFVPHYAVLDNTDGKNPALWAKDLKSTDFELLCPDGSRAPVSDHKKCKLGGASIQTAVSREDHVSDVVRIIRNQQSLFGRNGSQKDMFQMFSSHHGRNILFRDDTQCLIDFDRVNEIPIMYDYFGKNYLNSYKESHCFPPSGLTAVCSFHHC